MRWRLIGSEEVWFWLARIIKGRSQQVNTKRGDDKGSNPIIGFKVVHPDSVLLFSHERLNKAIKKLWARVVGQSHFGGVSQAVGMSIIEGIRIFSIVVGLGFVGGPSHVFGQLRREAPAQHLLHKRRRLVVGGGRLRSLWR